MKIFEEEFEKKTPEIKRLNEQIAGLELRQKQIIFETLEEAKQIYEKDNLTL